MRLTEPMDLRTGQPCWPQPGVMPADAMPERCEIAIVGAGVMGAMLADRLARDGHEVVVLDRRPPAHGSTAASTALVQWAAEGGSGGGGRGGSRTGIRGGRADRVIRSR